MSPAGGVRDWRGPPISWKFTPISDTTCTSVAKGALPIKLFACVASGDITGTAISLLDSLTSMGGSTLGESTMLCV